MISFGDPERSQVATLGINPSRKEFLDAAGHLLGNDHRRLAMLPSLGATRLDELDDSQVGTVVAECAAYFHRNPYRLWFDPLDELLRYGVGASYYDDTACHLDLVQWATDPVWSRIGDERVQRLLMEDGLPHLRAQLANSPHISLVLCNGRQVIEQVRAAGLANFRDAGTINHGAVKCLLFAGGGRGHQALWLAWSANLQGSFGVSLAFRRELANWIRQAKEDARMPIEREVPHQPDPTGTAKSARPSRSAVSGDYLPRGLRVNGKQELAAVLATWLDQSQAPTIGDIGSFGRTAWLRIDVGGTEVVLNADTKRTAVEQFVRASAAEPDPPWLVVASRGGHATKVLPGPAAEPAPGWYAYLTRPGTAGQLI